MNKRELLWGWIYFALQLLVLPTALVLLNRLLPRPLSLALLNILLYLLNFVSVCLIFHSFLWKSLQGSMQAPFRCLRYAFLGLLLYYLGSYAVTALVVWLRPDFANVNDQAILGMAQEHYGLMSLCTVFLVPVTEELFFRGLLFQGLFRKSRVAAYAVSSLCFAVIHITPYLGSYDLGLLGLCLLQYLPAGLALGWAYQKAGSIWAPILMHITINQIAISVLR